ncbi:hypothetical protein KP509_34G061400 [Ceratopteris richardii]|nr:hypothetical protein KP509_34G061400 [Ceratopteris richardii]
MLLRKLTAAAMLPSEQASEEFRLAAVKSLNRLFSGLSSCGRSFCGCRLSALPQQIVPSEGRIKLDVVPILNSLSQKVECDGGDDMSECHEDCLIEFLQSENMSAAVGHLFSVFLQISENESFKGRTGSTSLRVNAIATLRILILKVGAPDALAFFLPGVSSRLVKSLQSSKRSNLNVSELSYPVGAAGSPAALEQSIRALSELLALVLADERNKVLLGVGLRPDDSYASTTSPAMSISVEAALETIRNVSYLHEDNSNTDVLLMPGNKCISSDSSSGETFENIPVHKNEANVFHVDRNKHWLDFTVRQVKTLLAFCFPALCHHSSPSVRVAAAESAVLLISSCRISLGDFITTLLESLLAMACDTFPHVASVAQMFLTSLVADGNKTCAFSKGGLREIILRLLEKLPKAIHSWDENVCAFLARQLLSAIYFAGPNVVSECIFQSPTATAQFVDVISQCFSINLASIGTLQQLHIADRGSIAHIPQIIDSSEEKVVNTGNSSLSKDNFRNLHSGIEFSNDLVPSSTVRDSEPHRLPRLPPWFRQTNQCKFYPEIAGVIRFVGLSSMLGSEGGRNLFVLIEELLVPLRYSPFDSKGDIHGNRFIGQWQRRAAMCTAVLNEVCYGASGLWIDDSCLPFVKHPLQCKSNVSTDVGDASNKENINGIQSSCSLHGWKELAHNMPREALGNYIGVVLHEFSSDFIWKLPIDPIDVSEAEHGHILKDNVYLQQVMLEGIGVLAMSVGKLFEELGFLGSVLYLLLERLGCTSLFVSSTADLVLRTVSSACAYPSVRSLIVANTDYIVDALCRQLRHIEFFPNAPNMLVAVLRYTGAGQDLVTLLQEPMQSISLELEIPARQAHSANTLPMLRALKEVVKAAKAESACMLQTIVTRKESESAVPDENGSMSYWDEITSNLKRNERSRQALQEIVISCLNSSCPLLASKDQHKCLLALEITEVGVAAMSFLDALLKLEKEEKARASNLPGHTNEVSELTDSEPPKLLPTMHRVWPHLSACLKHVMPSVLIRASEVIASVVNSCGGDFFTRRFEKDVVPRFLSFLCQDTGFEVKKVSRKFLLSSRETSMSGHKDYAPASLFGVQQAVLSCLRDVGKNKKSSPALATTLDQLSAVVVGLACGIPDLQDLATQTLIALSNIDPDLIWILVADVAYGNSGVQSSQITSPGMIFPVVSDLLPPLVTQKDALWIQLTGKDIKVNIDGSKAWSILSSLESCHNGRSRLVGG